MRIYAECVRRGMPVVFEQNHRNPAAKMEYARPVLPIVDYAFILENGAAVMEGTREELLNNPDIRSAYFGI